METIRPLSSKTLKVGQCFGPHSFAVSQESHKKTISLLKENCIETTNRPFTSCRLSENCYAPSEIWGFARTISQHKADNNKLYFGGINEVALGKIEFGIYKLPKIGETLVSTVKVETTTFTDNHLPLAIFQTTTNNQSGEKIASSRESVILLHETKKPFYREWTSEKADFSRIKNLLSTKGQMKIFFRHKWREDEWPENIHTDRYAQKCGFKSGLPEFKTYIDFIYSILPENLKMNPLSINLNKILPMYLGDEISAFSFKESDTEDLQIYFVSKSDLSIRLQCAVRLVA